MGEEALDDMCRAETYEERRGTRLTEYGVVGREEALNIMHALRMNGRDTFGRHVVGGFAIYEV